MSSRNTDASQQALHGPSPSFTAAGANKVVHHKSNRLRLECAHAGEDSELQEEVSRLRRENTDLAQQVKSYQADVADLVSLRGVGHTVSRQKSQQQP